MHTHFSCIHLLSAHVVPSAWYYSRLYFMHLSESQTHLSGRCLISDDWYNSRWSTSIDFSSGAHSDSLENSLLLSLCSKWPPNPEQSRSCWISDLVGWVPETQGRGTLTILTSCLATIHALHLDRLFTLVFAIAENIVSAQVALWAKTIIAPEFIAVVAAQEWIQSSESGQRRFLNNQWRTPRSPGIIYGMFGLQYRTSRGTKDHMAQSISLAAEPRLAQLEGS